MSELVSTASAIRPTSSACPTWPKRGSAEVDSSLCGHRPSTVRRGAVPLQGGLDRVFAAVAGVHPLLGPPHLAQALDADHGPVLPLPQQDQQFLCLPGSVAGRSRGRRVGRSSPPGGLPSGAGRRDPGRRRGSYSCRRSRWSPSADEWGQGGYLTRPQLLRMAPPIHVSHLPRHRTVLPVCLSSPRHTASA